MTAQNVGQLIEFLHGFDDTTPVVTHLSCGEGTPGVCLFPGRFQVDDICSDILEVVADDEEDHSSFESGLVFSLDEELS